MSQSQLINTLRVTAVHKFRSHFIRMVLGDSARDILFSLQNIEP